MRSGVNAVVVPNRMQASDAFGPGSPDSVADRHVDGWRADPAEGDPVRVAHDRGRGVGGQLDPWRLDGRRTGLDPRDERAEPGLGDDVRAGRC